MNSTPIQGAAYRGRVAPSPQVGSTSAMPARSGLPPSEAADRGGTLILRNEDLDPQRCRPEFVRRNDRRFALAWNLLDRKARIAAALRALHARASVGPIILQAWKQLREQRGLIYPCTVFAEGCGAIRWAPRTKAMMTRCTRESASPGSIT